MIRFIHTADWHIGQHFYEYDRQYEHLLFFDWLEKQLEETGVSLLLIAGDVFDSPNPSAESQKLFYRYMHRLSVRFPNLQIVITAGNHDSAARLEAPNPLLEAMNIQIRGVVVRKEDKIDPTSLLVPIYQNGEVKAVCLAVPYLRQGDYPAGEKVEENTYADGIARMYTLLTEHAQTIYGKHIPLIAMGHFQAMGGSLNDGDKAERQIMGGSEAVAIDTFMEAIDYLALGHLHRSQRVGATNKVRYSGTPLPMSFAELNYKHGVDLVELENGEEPQFEHLVYASPVKLMSLSKTPLPLDAILEKIAALPDGVITDESPYLEIKVLNNEPDPSRRFKIEQALEGKSVRLSAITAVSTNAPSAGRKELSFEELQTLSPFELGNEAYRQQYGDDMPDNLQSLFKTAIEQATEEINHEKE